METLKFWIGELLDGDTERARQVLQREYNIAEDTIEAIKAGRVYNLDLSHIQEGSR